MIDADALIKLAFEQRRAALDTLANRRGELEWFFGTAKERAERAPGSDEPGRSARIIFDDASVQDVAAVLAIDHNSIDRFTGGTRTGALYAEETLLGGTIEATITILPPTGVGDERPWSRDLQRAFCSALRDLCEGRLAIGAKSLGFCEGNVDWNGAESDVGSWREIWEICTAHPSLHYESG
jgi:hypothetical protein